MAKKITPEAFQFILSTVSSLVHMSTAIAHAHDSDLPVVEVSFDDKGEELWKATKDWLDLLGIASSEIGKDFYRDYGLKRPK